MSEVRAAAYLATVQRLDRKNSSGTIKCKPPNERCGGRCIPPSWDCRLKGEGSDPHLRAVKTDPLKGLASIERGTTRLFKGISKGSFSDVEGGKAAIIRGTVKIAPGDLQQKKQLQSDLENNTRYVGIGLAVITGGLGVHAILMRSNFRGYRYNVGAKIEAATREGINKVLDATPLIGQHRAQNSSAVKQLVSETAYRIRSQQLQGPDTLRGTLGKGGEASLAGVSLSSDLIDSASVLNTRLTGVNEAFINKNLLNSASAFEKWNKSHRKGFWSVNETSAIGGRKPNIFARPTAESYIRKQYNLTAEESATRLTIEAALINRVSDEQATLIRLAKQQGFKVKRTANRELIDSEDIPAFVSSITQSNFSSSAEARSLQRSVQEHLTSIITKSPSDNASRIYRDTVKGFDNYYNSVGVVMADVRRTARINPDQRSRGYNEIIQAADRARSNYLASSMNLQRSVSGDAHAELINRAYFATRVSGTANSTYYVSERLARSAASEIVGRPINTNEEAYRLLTTQFGFTGATKTQSRTTKPRSPALLEESSSVKDPNILYFSDGRKMTVGWSERVRRILAREGNENMSTDAAFKIAQVEQKQQKKGSNTNTDSIPDRVSTYLLLRNDFQSKKRQGKPCGNSYIPKTFKCSKREGSVSNKTAALALGTLATLTAGAAATYSNRTKISLKLIKTLSSSKVKQGLKLVPPEFQDAAKSLVGKSKVGLAGVLLSNRGYKLTDVNPKLNSFTYKALNGEMASVSSVDDSLIIFKTYTAKSIDFGDEKINRYVFDFTVDLQHSKTSGDTNARHGLNVASNVKSLFRKHVSDVPDNSYITVEAYGKDLLGEKRKSIYTKLGFTPIGEKNSIHLWALKDNGKINKLNKRAAFSVATALRDPKNSRNDSFISYKYA